jgi:predicted DNA-binding transcriptional regulator AlpA
MRAQELIDDPILADELPEALVILAAQLCEVRKAKQDGNSQGDRLVSIDEAALRLNLSRSWIYQRSRSLPFIVRNGRKLSASARGLEEYITARKGRL